MDKNFRSYMAELFGTFALVFVAAASVCAHQLLPADQPRPGLVGIALAEALALAATLACTLSISGGYLNPAITLMLWVFKRLDGGKTVMFIFVQLLGAALAGGLVRLIFAGNLETLTLARMGTPHLNLAGYTGLSMMANISGIVAEICLTFILTMTIFATLIDPRAPKVLGPIGAWLAPLWIGLVMAALLLAGFNLTGAAVNPARWFGTVIWEFSVPALQTTRPFLDHMTYWFGPIIGALLGGGVYTSLILPPEAGDVEFREPIQTGAGSTLFKSKK